MKSNNISNINDLEISKKYQKLPITEIAKKLKIENAIVTYGLDKAKIDLNKIKKNKIEKKGKLVLITSINPTPYGEGKTTTAIGLTDALCRLHQNSIVALREPSLGPVFGIKGGACGGGHSQVVPMEDINLHFTGDMHAITSANNLISSAIDNHLYFGNELNIDPNQILFKRCLDINDRALRKIKLEQREENFNITAASEVMSVLCLSNDLENLKENLANIRVAYTKTNKPIYVKDLGLTGSLAVILKDAINPNLVQTLENNPALIHGGPFANIAHGCSSIIATNLALKLADYTITEAGFGSDLGAEKFLDIKCRRANLTPNCIVIVATIKALKYNAGIVKEEILKSNPQAVKRGLSNLEIHIDNMLKYTSNVIVTLNKYKTDTKEEIEVIESYLKRRNIPFSLNDAYNKGSIGALTLAKQVLKTCNKKTDFHYLYPLNISIKEKINIIAKEIYHAPNVDYSPQSLEKIKKLEELNLTNLEICIAKTQYSLSDNPKLLSLPKNYTIKVRDIEAYTGAGFIVVYLGKIMTMPGLAKNSNYLNIDITKDGIIKGLF